MNRYTFERAIKARLKQQGCDYVDAASTAVSMCFVHGTKQFHFYIPRPTQDEGWTLVQLNYITQVLESWGLEFLPLDYLF